MNINKRLLILSMLLFSASPAVKAQMTIDQLDAPLQEEVRLESEMKTTPFTSAEYFSLARHRAEVAAIRKERNTLEITAGLQATLTSYNDPWVSASGGDNATTLLGTFNLNHVYKKDKITVTSKVAATFGFNRMQVESTDDDGNTTSEGVWFKNQDEFSISVAPTYSLSEKWSYGPSVTFRTQFANGYKSRSEQEDIHLKSGFMAPGYLDVSGGVTYKCPNKKWPMTITMAPAALSATYVTDEYIRENFLYQYLEHTDGNWAYTDPYGVSPYSNSKYEGGSSLQIDYDRTFEKFGKVRYATTIYTFYGWMTQLSAKNMYSNYDDYQAALTEWSETQEGYKPELGIRPTVRWENTLTIPATTVLSTIVKFQLYYNRAQDVNIQTQTYLSVGLAYTFKNK